MVCTVSAVVGHVTQQAREVMIDQVADATALPEIINEDRLHVEREGPTNRSPILSTRKKPIASKTDHRKPIRHHLNRNSDVENTPSTASSDSSGCLISVAVGRSDEMGADAVVTLNSNGADPNRGVDGRILSMEGHTAIHRLGQSFHAYKEVTGLSHLPEGEVLKTWADKIKGASMLIHIVSPQLQDAENPTVDEKLSLFRAYSSILQAAVEEGAKELSLPILDFSPSSSPSARVTLQMAALHAVLSCSPTRIRCILFCVPTADDAAAFKKMIRGLNYLPIADDDIAIRLNSILCAGYLEIPTDFSCRWQYREIITIDADIIRIADDSEKEGTSRDHDPLLSSLPLQPVIPCPISSPPSLPIETSIGYEPKSSENTSQLDERTPSPSIVEIQPDFSEESETIEQAETSEVAQGDSKGDSAVKPVEDATAESTRESSSPNENTSEEAEKIDDQSIVVDTTVTDPVPLDPSPRKRGRPKKDASLSPPEPEKKKVKQNEDPLLVGTRWSTRLVERKKK